MLKEGYQIQNLISSSGSGINYGSEINYGSDSDFLTSYGSGSGSTSQKVMFPVPVPSLHASIVSVHCSILSL